MYRYNGIDVSLFDYCSGVYAALSEAIKEGGLDRDRLILGATAANWRASVRERAVVTVDEACRKALHTVDRTKIPLLLKVDEPGLFVRAKNKQIQVDKIPLMQQFVQTSNNDSPPRSNELSPRFFSNLNSPPLSGPPLSGVSDALGNNISRAVTTVIDVDEGTPTNTLKPIGNLDETNTKTDRGILPAENDEEHTELTSSGLAYGR